MSQTGPKDQRARPLELAPFRALRFSPDLVADLATVTCPPYDVIGESGIAAWEAADPHNVVRLILPRPGSHEDRYAHAARELRGWLQQELLRPDDAPALYVYEHAAGDATALGLVGAVSVHDPDEQVVLPHEEVFPGPVTDRAELMAATGAQFEPILLTYSGGGPATMAVDAATAGEPVVAVTTSDGARHRLWPLTDLRVLAQIQADLAGRRALIADGHHRYAAYRALRDRFASATGTDPSDPKTMTLRPEHYGLAMLVDADRHPLRLSSIHRSVAVLPLSEVVTRAATAFRGLTPLPARLDPVQALAKTDSRPAYVISDGRSSVLLHDLVSNLVDAGLPAGRSSTWRRLDASIACEYVLPKLFGVEDADRRVAYHHDAADALCRARNLGGTALLLRPANHADVLAVALGGERMPRKSTSFGPKPRTGLLMRLLRNSPEPAPGPASARN